MNSRSAFQASIRSCLGYLRDFAQFPSNVVGPRRHLATPAGPIGMEELAARFIDSLVGVGAEEISLGLQQVRRKPGRAESVVERERRGESRRRHAGLNRPDDAAAPGGFVIVQNLAEEIGNQQIGEMRILVVSFLDLAEEAASDDATTAPH